MLYFICMKTDKKKKRIIYCIRRKQTGCRYFGLTLHPNMRIPRHAKLFDTLGADIRKYGWDYFSIRIMMKNLTLKQAKESEKYYIRKYNSMEPMVIIEMREVREV